MADWGRGGWDAWRGKWWWERLGPWQAWLDRQLETTVLEPAGFLLGFILGLTSIVRLAAANRQK